MNRYSLVSEKLFPIRTDDDRMQMLSLPDVLSYLSTGKDIIFSDLQIHQQHAWHAFLVQLAAMGLASNSIDEANGMDSESWKSILLGMTDGDENPWCLIVSDWDKPAFMQPPSPKGTHFKSADNRKTISELDILVLSKSHDVKINKIAKPSKSQWIFNLITYQTMSGVLGRENYNIARMNSGLGSRPCVTLKFGNNWGLRFLREVNSALKIRAEMATDDILGFSYNNAHGHQLLWTLTWDGLNQINIEDCDTLFIEVCRRIRLQEDNHVIEAYFTGSKNQRMNAAFLKGRTGDLWTPLDTSKDSVTALTVSEAGFSYELMRRILFEDQLVFSPLLSAQIDADDDFEIYAEVVSRGQGKTAGFHKRILPMPKKISRLFSTQTSKQALAERAKEYVDDAKCIKKIMKIALLVFLQGNKPKLNYDDHRHEKIVQRLDNSIDSLFFHHLWETSEMEPTEARIIWRNELSEEALRMLHQAFNSLPCPESRKYKSMTYSERAFRSQVYQQFQIGFREKGGAAGDSVADK